MSHGFFHRLASRGIDVDSSVGPPPFRVISASERAVRDLEAWLNHALQQPEATYPRIPIRLVSAGGWRTLERPEERAAADAWWDHAFAACEIDR